MTVYKVEIDESVREDVEDLKQFLRSVMSREGAHRYIEAIYGEMMSLSVFADCFAESRSTTIRRVHPGARRMVSHNKRWVYIFHVEDETVIVDRIRPSKLITK